MLDGYLIYQGIAKDATSYFSQIGYKCPRFANPADFMIRLVQIEYPKGPEEEKRIEFFVNKYNEN
jgi:hypothetical protein